MHLFAFHYDDSRIVIVGLERGHYVSYYVAVPHQLIPSIFSTSLLALIPYEIVLLFCCCCDCSLRAGILRACVVAVPDNSTYVRSKFSYLFH